MAPDRFRVELLDARHNRSEFACGVDALDRYFRQQAGQETRRRAAAVYVLVDVAAAVVAGYYTLSSIGIESSELPDDVARRLPRYPVLPGMLIGRLAVDRRYQGQGFGGVLVRDAAGRAYELSASVGAALIVVDEKDASVARFSAQYGFQPLPSDPLRLFIPMGSVSKL